jgi:glycosyltransferase involved in cell wall biosynthesis
MPKVSVIIPTYNSAKYLSETLQSVFSQTYRNIEIVVVDDGSTDNTREIINSFSLPEIKYIYQENSGGPASPRNKGILASEGRYLAIFDSDDVMLPEKIEKQVAFIRSHSHIGLVFTDFLKFDDIERGSSGRTLYPGRSDLLKIFPKIQKQNLGDNRYLIKSRIAYEALIYENFIGTSSVFVSREVFSRVGLFDESLRNADDRQMWIRISRNYDIGLLDDVCHHYRVRKGSITRQEISVYENKIKMFRKLTENPGLERHLYKEAKKQIADCYRYLGYLHQRKVKMREARKNYFTSLKENIHWRSIRGILITFLPMKVYSWFRNE